MKALFSLTTFYSISIARSLVADLEHVSDCRMANFWEMVTRAEEYSDFRLVRNSLRVM